MSAAPEVNVERVIDEAPLRAFQLLIAVISAVVILIDGYDTLCIGFVAPALAKELGQPVASFGPVFAGGLSGLIIGSLFISPLADRFGRKRLLIVAILIFGLFTLAPTLDLDYGRLIIYRFVTGLGLGSAMPCAITLTTEFAPRRYRALLTNSMFVGFPLGGAIAGLTAGHFLADQDWRSVFLIGSIVPLLLVLPIAFFCRSR